MITPVETKNGTGAKSGGGLFTLPDGRNLLVTFILVTSLFSLWGFCNGMIDILNKHFQNTLHINKFQSGFVQFANYLAYFLMAIPAGLLARRFGYKGGIIIGLVLIATGALWFIPATHIGTYWAFLTGLFILATGMTCLETIANPYATVLGPPESGATRINFSQTFNGVGWILGPIVGGMFVFSGTDPKPNADANGGLYLPYLGVGIAAVIMVVIFSFAYIPDLQAVEEARVEVAGTGRKPLFQRWHFVLGVAAQFFYVAAQTGIFSFFINYVVENDHSVPEKQASWMLGAYGFVLFTLGRFCGSALISVSKPNWVLSGYAGVCALLTALAMGGGKAGFIGLLGTFFFMSIMFPTIFALAIRGLGEHTKLGSSLIVMSIVGGALAPPLMGHIADISSMRVGFAVPLVCFVLIAIYGAVWQKLENKDQ
jgi:FHS family L-fucose permease-like MFS transporter